MNSSGPIIDQNPIKSRDECASANGSFQCSGSGIQSQGCCRDSGCGHLRWFLTDKTTVLVLNPPTNKGGSNHCNNEDSQKKVAKIGFLFFLVIPACPESFLAEGKYQ
jgi:hypothetical protein